MNKNHERGVRLRFLIVPAGVLVLAAWGVVSATVPSTSSPAAPVRAEEVPAKTPGVGALGRIGPRGGVRHIAGPSEMVKVLGKLLVDEGDTVKAGQVIAILDDFEIKQADVQRMEAAIRIRAANAKRSAVLVTQARADYERVAKLATEGLVPTADRDTLRRTLDAAIAAEQAAREDLSLAEADLVSAKATLARRTIRSPVDGLVVRVHARAGEKIHELGVLDVVPTQVMVATAEVYESDISRVRLGQSAVVESRVLGRRLTGKVARIASEVGRLTLQDATPTAPRDVRVVEVEVVLDDPAAAERFTGLTVTVRFEE